MLSLLLLRVVVVDVVAVSSFSSMRDRFAILFVERVKNACGKGVFERR